MSATMQFGPEWMRTKPQNSPRSGATQAPPSPPPPLSNSSSLSGAATTRGADEANPFRYSKEDLLRIYKEGGGGGKGHPIAPDVEKWPEVVRETEAEPISLREITNEERKLFADSLNSTIRRRQSTDVMSSPLGGVGGERPRFSQTNSATGNRFGGLIGRRRDGAEPLTLPRRLSQSGQPPLGSPREAALPSPRLRGPTTPTFDGILSGVDSRLAKRKLSSAARGDLSATDHLNDRKNPDIKEDVELSSDNPSVEQSGTQNQAANGTSNTSHDPAQHHHHQNGDPGQASAQGPDLVAQGLSNMSISNQANGHPPNPDLSTSATPIITDLAAVEWSYLDPQGQVQGPFRADVMQKWFDDGYFAPELLMRRTHLDADWTPVGELCRLAGYEKVFLRPPRPPVGPPGITRRPDMSAQDPITAGATTKGFASSSSPYQPIPTRLRTTALDNFPSTGSNPSDSPASSFGAGRFGNGSPDPAAFGGRAGMSAAAAVHEQGSPFGNRRGPFAVADQSRIARTPSYGNIAPGRTNTFSEGGYRTDEAYLPDAPSWPTSAGQYSNYNSPVISHQVAFGTRSIHESPMLQHAAAHVYPQNDFTALNAGLSRVSLDRAGSMGVDAFGLGINGGGPAGGQAAFVGSPALAHMQHQQHQQQAAPGGPVTNVAPSPLVIQGQPATPYHQPTSSVTQSPWDTPAPTQGIRRPGPFDQHLHPMTSNVFVTASLAPEPENNNAWSSMTSGGSISLGQSESQSQKEQSSWLKSSEGVIDERWKPVSGRHELTVSNLGEHNQQFKQQQQQQQEQQSVQPQELGNAAAGAATTSPQESAKPEPVVAEPAAPAPAPAPAPSSTGGKKKKNSTQQPAAETPAAPATSTTTSAAAVPPSAPTTKEATSPSTPAPTQVQAQTPTPSAAAPAAKSPWGIDEENKKTKTIASTPGLREIQEAETKKKSERERLARAATAITSSSTATASNNAGNEEATESFSWGLPTSQTGSRAANGVKEGSGPTSAAGAVAGTGAGAGSAGGASAPTAVWGAVGGTATAAKKTMKEIQEEEERQKKLAVKESMAAAAARRAYAETTSTAKPAAPAAPGNAWHTVGANGKTGAMTPLAAARPPTAAAVAAGSPAPVNPTGAASPAASTAARVVANNAGALRPTTAAAVAAATRPVGNSRTEDFPIAPSQEFIKWLTESLKGLNNGVKLEEIASMLLSFPLDPDASTTEIISETIYANSTTLDGRRFATEFISRRKQDAASRAKNGAGVGTVNGSAAPAKAISIADIVKTQPKSKEPEWGGFKVHVNKKKKGGRA